jgi:hypothetical protein
MPPRKRIATPSDEGEEGTIDEESAPVEKKVKATPKAKKPPAAPKPKKVPEKVGPLNPDYPVNLTVECPVGGFEKKADGTIRISGMLAIFLYHALGIS